MVYYYYNYKLKCHTEKLVCYLQSQGHCKGLYNKNLTIFALSSKLQILGLMVHHHNPECPVKNWDAVLKVTAKDQIGNKYSF